VAIRENLYYGTNVLIEDEPIQQLLQRDFSSLPFLGSNKVTLLKENSRANSGNVLLPAVPKPYSRLHNNT
jgi:hypothetical protein